MNKFLKNTILIGLGAAQYSKDKIEELVKSLVEEENLNPEEGKKMVQEMIEKAQSYRDTQTKEIKKMVSDAVKELGLATKNDIDALEKKLKPAKKATK